MNNLEKTAGVPKAYAVIGIGALYFFLIIFNLGGQLLTNLAGFGIPAYYSLGALFSANKEDDTQWLTVRLPPESLLVASWIANHAAVLGRFLSLHRC